MAGLGTLLVPPSIPSPRLSREAAERRSVLHIRKTKNITIGAEIVEKSLLVSHDLAFSASPMS
jgi:hypothetical protein